MAPFDRRSFLRTVAGATGVLTTGAVGATTTRPTRTVDTEVTVAVGPGGELAFEPELTRISRGTTVRFVWESDDHNVVVDERPGGADWVGTPDGPETVYDAGHEYRHTFETAGRYEFHCAPHRSAGMEGAIEVFEPDVTVTVGLDGELAYDPETVEVDLGGIVRWVWDSDNHNVAVESHPEGADFAGTPGDEFYDAGYEFVHPFDVAGTHEYYCTPHRSAGMVGSVVVDGAATTDGPRSGEVGVDVGPGGELVFDPEAVTVERGTEVVWTWASGNHNLVVDDQPDGADWAGTPGSDDELYDEGYEYRHTFDVVGTYEYHCTPHNAAGMQGSITVVEPETTSAPATTEEPTTAGGETTGGTTTEGDDGTDEGDGDEEGESIPFSGPAVVGGGALAGGALARLRGLLDDD